MRALLAAAVLVSASPASHAAPRIACPSPVHEFGSMDNSRSVERDFEIRNEGDEALIIGRIRACCGATAKMSSKAIEPGTNATFRIKLSLRGRKGKQRKSFYIASNDPKQPYFQVRMIGTAVASVDVQPRSISFGRVLAEAALTNVVRITCQSNHAFRVTNVVCSVDRFAVDVSSPEQGTHEVAVKTVPPLAPGVTKGMVTLLTDHPQHRRILIPVTATVSSDLVVVPREILLTEAEDAGPVTRYVAIRSRSGTAFKVTKVEPPDDGIEPALSPLGKAGWRCELKNMIPFEGLDGSHVTFETDHPSAGKVAVPIRIVGRGSGK